MHTHRTPARPLVTASLLMACVFLVPATAEAQFGRRSPQQGPDARVQALEVGIRGGLDVRFEDIVLGAHLRVPIDPWNRIEFMPGALVTFDSSDPDIQFDLDGVIVVDPAGVFFVGGGASFRDTVTGTSEESSFETGYNLIAGAKTPRGPDDEGFQVQLEFRFTDVAGLDHSIVTLGANYPLHIF